MSFNFYLLYKWFVYSIFFYCLFFCVYIFDSLLKDIRFIIQRYLTNNAGEKLLSRYGAAIIRRHYSSFEENYRHIVNFSLPSKKNAPRKVLPRIPFPRENYHQGIKLPFKKFKLYVRLNMIRWIIKPRNLEELFNVRCC